MGPAFGTVYVQDAIVAHMACLHFVSVWSWCVIKQITTLLNALLEAHKQTVKKTCCATLCNIVGSRARVAPCEPHTEFSEERLEGRITGPESFTAGVQQFCITPNIILCVCFLHLSLERRSSKIIFDILAFEVMRKEEATTKLSLWSMTAAAQTSGPKRTRSTLNKTPLRPKSNPSAA